MVIYDAVKDWGSARMTQCLRETGIAGGEADYCDRHVVYIVYWRGRIIATRCNFHAWFYGDHGKDNERVAW